MEVHFVETILNRTFQLLCLNTLPSLMIIDIRMARILRTAMSVLMMELILQNVPSIFD